MHPFDDDGRQTLAAEPCAATIRAVRAACPGISISLTTSADVEPNPQRRMALVEAWTETPDLVTANQGEDSILEMCELLVARGIWNRGRTAISRRRAALRGCRHRRPLFPHHGRTARRDPDAAVAHAEAIGRTLAAVTSSVHHGGASRPGRSIGGQSRADTASDRSRTHPVLPDGRMQPATAISAAAAAMLARSVP